MPDHGGHGTGKFGEMGNLEKNISPSLKDCLKKVGENFEKNPNIKVI